MLPMLASPAGNLPPRLDDWAAEFKWDGMRAIVAVHRGAVRAWSRTGSDITGRYPELAAIAPARGPTLILDGEIVALHGSRPDFSELQRRMHTPRPRATLLAAVPVTFIAFDLLQAGTRTLTGNPFRQRRALLSGLGLEERGVIISPAFPGEDAADVLAVASTQGYEGIILKRPGSTYMPGRRSRDWLKIKITRTQEVIICGWAPGQGGRAGMIGSLLLGIHDDAGRLVYAGHVGTGFTAAMLDDLLARLRPLERAASPFTAPVPARHARGARWAEPVLVGEVAYLEWTADGSMRQPSWRGLRPDKEPRAVRRET
jgi:bifunctional non-homologous end joining protein LigD